MDTIKRILRFVLRSFGYAITRLPGQAVSSGKILPKQAVPSGETLPRSKSTNPSHRSLRINMHHVGGRTGGFPMPFNSKFYDSAEMYIYDADPDCAAQMKSASPNVDHVITAAVGGVDGEAVFYVNHDPYTSSLLPPRAGDRTFYQDASCDYIMSDVLVPLKTLNVKARSLDSLAREHVFQVDYLSLDVEGAEFELLSGATDSILRNTVGIMCEFSFLPLHEGQKLFDEIVALLREKGFFVANIFPSGVCDAFPQGNAWATYRSAIGWRGNIGFVAVGDALFLRDPLHIVEHAERPFLSLLKLAFLSMCFGNVAYALQCLEEAYKKPEAGVLSTRDDVSYIGFLDDMHRLYGSEEHIYPPRFSHLWTAEQSLARFNLDGHLTPKDDIALNEDKKVARSAYFSEADQESFFRIAPRLLDPSFTAFEVLLEENNFTPLAESVRKKRIVSIKQTLGALGIKVKNGVIQREAV